MLFSWDKTKRFKFTHNSVFPFELLLFTSQSQGCHFSLSVSYYSIPIFKGYIWCKESNLGKSVDSMLETERVLCGRPWSFSSTISISQREFCVFLNKAPKQMDG